MSDDIRQAFAHPAERALASGQAERDRISLRDYVVAVEIGAFQSERGTTQRVRFNVVVEVQPQQGPLSDDVDRILSYDAITDAIEAELSEERLNLLETLAERIADHILADPKAARVFVRIEKLDRGPGALGVEIERSADAARAGGGDAAHPHPVVVFLSNAVIHGDRLGVWLDHFQSTGAPVILCLGPADMPRPAARNAQAQRRIDLLAIEQNAWVLAALDRRCVVVATRTEMDWAMKHGQMTVWAPSKFVLDAVDHPRAAPDSDAARLALWLARHLDAQKLVVLGQPAPEAESGSDLPVESRDPAQAP